MCDRDVAIFNHDAKKKAAVMENLKDDVDVASDMRYCLESKNLDDDEYKCKICCLSFKSQQDLHDHNNEAYTYCYQTLQEAQNNNY